MTNLNLAIVRSGDTVSVTDEPRMTFRCCYQLGVLVCQWFEIIFQFSHSVFSVLKDLVFLVLANSVENRLALWRVLALAMALSDPSMCQPVWVGNLIIIFLNTYNSKKLNFL